MKAGRLSLSLTLALGLAMALLWLLGSDTLPLARAATIGVNTTGDGVALDGNCTLREAIVAANTDTGGDCAAGNGADAITLLAGTYALTASGSGEDGCLTGDLDVTSTLSIVGAGPRQTVIDASGLISDRVFDVRPGAGSVVISGVTIVNGTVVGDGGGIYTYDASLTLVNAIVSSNVATSTPPSTLPPLYGGGGGVYVRGGSATFSDTRIVSNTSYYGGGLFLRNGSATLNGGQIAGNTARYGGGVYINQHSVTFTQTGASTIACNSATDIAGGVYVGPGHVRFSGAQIVSNTAGCSGGGVFVGSGSATLSGVRIAGNVASGTASSYGGGGLCLGQGSATLSGGQVISNTAYQGGGLYNGGGTLTVVNTTVSGNRATEGGGGLWNGDASLGNSDVSTSVLTYTTIASNTSLSGGGGVHWTSSTVLLQNTIVAYNSPGNCNAGPASNGHNLEDGTTCGLSATGDMSNTDPLLGPLSDDNGTLVHPLLEGSPAIEGGVCIAGVASDQRGVRRPEGARCDIGAYEWDWQEVYLPLVVLSF